MTYSLPIKNFHAIGYQHIGLGVEMTNKVSTEPHLTILTMVEEIKDIIHKRDIALKDWENAQDKLDRLDKQLAEKRTKLTSFMYETGLTNARAATKSGLKDF
jgi:hypothetical protein